jgi:peptide/nickel transport system substrate-binding protein
MKVKAAAITRTTQLVVVVLIVVILAVSGIVAVEFSGKTTTLPSTTASNASTNSVTSSSTSSSSSASSTAVNSTSSASSSNNTLVLDDTFWPAFDFNQLYLFTGTPYPQWGLYSVYQSLVSLNESAAYGSGTIQYLPGLANNWTVSPNGTTYTFNLRQGVSFSNGDPLNAYQVWAEMYLIYYISGNSSSWLESYSVFDMSKVNFGSSTISLLNQSGLVTPSAAALSLMENSSWPIYVVGQNQIVFRLEHPIQYFLGLMIAWVGEVFDSQYVLVHGGPGTPTAVNVYFNTNPIPGTGPYVISQIAEQSFAVFTQNPAYWGKSLSAQQIQINPALDPGHVKNIVIYYKPDDLSRYVDLSSGKAQLAAIGAADWNSITSNPAKYSYFKVPKFSTLEALYSLNTQSYPTNITDVRQAIVHAINYTDLIDKAFSGQGQELVAPEYPVFGQYYDLPNLQPYTYNVTLAKQYLTSSGIKSPISLTFIGSSTTKWQGISAQVMQADLAQIGITLTIDMVPYAQCQTYQGGYSFNLQESKNASTSFNIEIPGCGPWGPFADTPVDAWASFASNRSTAGNTAGYSNPTVENAINALFDGDNLTYSQSLMKQAQTQFYNDAALITVGIGLFYEDGSLAWQNGVINSFLVDPLTTGADTMPILNTITLG